MSAPPSDDAKAHALLSAARIAWSPEAAGDGAVPFGLILQPLAPIPPSSILHRAALRCTRCGAYPSPHCAVGRSSWRCGSCGGSNVLEETSAIPPEFARSVVEYIDPDGDDLHRGEIEGDLEGGEIEGGRPSGGRPSATRGEPMRTASPSRPPPPCERLTLLLVDEVSLSPPF